MSSTHLPVWPYPRWIAHRGAGRLAPENTLAAFRLGAAHGYRMFECDVKLSADGVPFLLHDAELTRTAALPAGICQPGDPAATESGPALTRLPTLAGAVPWSTLSRCDAGSWHSPRYAGEPLPTLAAIAHFVLANSLCVNLEIKPSPGTERRTGEVVAQHAAQLWQGQPIPPLLSSFDPAALEGALAAAPDLPRALLIDTLQDKPWEHWLQCAGDLQCQALVCQYRLWDASSVASARAHGLRCLSYTVNDPEPAARLLALGLDGLITDALEQFAHNQRPLAGAPDTA